MDEQTFFNKVSQVTLNELVDFMVHNQIELNIKVDDQYIKTTVHTKKNTKLMTLVKFSTEEFNNKSVTCLLRIGDDKYLFKSFLSNNKASCLIEIPREILYFQRRSDFRAPVPTGVHYKCEVIGINGTRARIKAEIRDMSLGGCQISVDGLTSDIKPDDELELYIKLNKFEFQKLLVIAKHIKPSDVQNTTLIGASLLEPDSELKSELQSMMLYLDRVHRGKIEK
ncbi:MAG: PilZ domain-containing protein [Bdellovibrionota bacterium]